MSRNTHSRTSDHHGTDLDTSILLAADIGDFGAGMALPDVLAALISRIVALETKFNIHALYSAGVIKAPITGSFGTSAIRCRANGSFPGWEGSFTANAVIV